MERQMALARLVTVLVFGATACIAQERADYFIIADPDEYAIFNQYEQPLSASEKQTFLFHTPLRIVERNLTLGDQITKALKFSFQQNNYYLLKSDKGVFIGETAKRGRQSLMNCQPFDDTIEVTGGGKLKMVDGSGAVVTLDKGILCLRIFRTGARYYILPLGDDSRFGWSTLEPRTAWKKAGIAAVSPQSCVLDTTLPLTVKERIVEEMLSTNEAYKAIFSHFNELTKEEKTIPQWKYECGRSRIRCELIGPYKNSDQLAESTRSLAKKLEKLLVGTDFLIIHEKGELCIRRRVSGG